MKKTEKSQEQKTEQTAPVSEEVSLVKAIKNKLFKEVKIGGNAVVAGIIRKIEDETGTYGDYVRFTGDFACQVNGVVYKSGKMYLPDVAANVLKSGFLQASEHVAEGESPSIEFKIRLTKTPDDDKSNQNGFQWSAQPLLDPKPESDRILQLLA